VGLTPNIGATLLGIFSSYYPQRLSFSIFFPYTDTSSTYKYYQQMFLTLACTQTAMELIVYPLNKWRTLLYTHVPEVGKPRMNILAAYLERESIFSLWRGVGLSMTHVILQNALFCLSLFGWRNLAGSPNETALFYAGFTSGTILYPIDTLVRRVQNDSLINKHKRTYRKAFQAMSMHFKEHGLAGFYRGYLMFVVTQACMLQAFGRVSKASSV
jgi:hypothetical protein